MDTPRLKVVEPPPGYDLTMEVLACLGLRHRPTSMRLLKKDFDINAQKLQRVFKAIEAMQISVYIMPRKELSRYGGGNAPLGNYAYVAKLEWPRVQRLAARYMMETYGSRWETEQ